MNMRSDPLAMREARPPIHARPNTAAHDREITAALRTVQALRALAPAVMARLAAGAIRLEVARGERLFDAAAHCAGPYILASGRLALSVGNPDAGHKVIRLAETGDVIGLSAALLGIATFASAEALVDSTVILLPRETLVERAQRDAPLAFALATIAAQQARNFARDLEAISLQSGRQRIVQYLLASSTTGPAAAPAVLLPAKKSIIASRLSVTPEYFSRTLHELISAGAINVNGRQIVIRDAARLRSNTRPD